MVSGHVDKANDAPVSGGCPDMAGASADMTGACASVSTSGGGGIVVTAVDDLADIADDEDEADDDMKQAKQKKKRRKRRKGKADKSELGIQANMLNEDEVDSNGGSMLLSYLQQGVKAL